MRAHLSLILTSSLAACSQATDTGDAFDSATDSVGTESAGSTSSASSDPTDGGSASTERDSNLVPPGPNITGAMTPWSESWGLNRPASSPSIRTTISASDASTSITYR